MVHNWLDQGLAVTLGSPVVGARLAMCWCIHGIARLPRGCSKLLDSLPRLTVCHYCSNCPCKYVCGLYIGNLLSRQCSPEGLTATKQVDRGPKVVSVKSKKECSYYAQFLENKSSVPSVLPETLSRSRIVGKTQRYNCGVKEKEYGQKAQWSGGS